METRPWRRHGRPSAMVRGPPCTIGLGCAAERVLESLAGLIARSEIELSVFGIEQCAALGDTGLGGTVSASDRVGERWDSSPSE